MGPNCPIPDSGRCVASRSNPPRIRASTCPGPRASSRSTRFTPRCAGGRVRSGSPARPGPGSACCSGYSSSVSGATSCRSRSRTARCRSSRSPPTCCASSRRKDRARRTAVCSPPHSGAMRRVDRSCSCSSRRARCRPRPLGRSVHCSARQRVRSAACCGSTAMRAAPPPVASPRTSSRSHSAPR